MKTMTNQSPTRQQFNHREQFVLKSNRSVRTE